MRNLAKRIASVVARLACWIGVHRSNKSEHNDEKPAGSQPTRKRSPKETLDAILESDLDDEAERILALSDEELEKELVEAGFDLERVRARGPAIYERTRSSPNWQRC